MLGAGAVSRQMSRNAIRKIVPPIHHRDTGAQRNIETTNPIKTNGGGPAASSPSFTISAESRLSLASVVIKFQEDLKNRRINRRYWI